MKQELIKNIIKVGNSAGVLLPKQWLNGKAKVELIEKPMNIKREVLEILYPYLDDILGIYLTGSYARGEQSKESDIDILVITEKENRKINEGKYEVILISKKNLERILKKNILPLLPMLKEAKSILNSSLIGKYKKLKINNSNTKWHIDTTKSILKMNKDLIDTYDELGNKIPDGVVYSLVLRLREVYIVRCLKEGKIPTIKGLKQIIKNLTGSLKPYEAYIRIKKGKKEQEIVSVETTIKIYEYLKKEIENAR